MTLSQARWGLAATTVKNLLFAGGNNGASASNVVDIYNSVDNT